MKAYFEREKCSCVPTSNNRGQYFKTSSPFTDEQQNATPFKSEKLRALHNSIENRLSLLAEVARPGLVVKTTVDVATGLQSCFAFSSFMKRQQCSFLITCTGKESVQVAILILKRSFVLFNSKKF